MNIESEIKILNKEQNKVASLKKQNQELQGELMNLQSFFNIKSAEEALSNIKDDDFEEFVGMWSKEVREKTDFFKEADDFGMELFKDDLEHQDNFPIEGGVEIIFDPDPAVAPDESWKNNTKYSVGDKPKYIDDLRLIGDGENLSAYAKINPSTVAMSFRTSKLIQLFKVQKPSLKEQFIFFIINGKAHPIVNSMIHEMIHKFHHKYHQDKNSEVELLITEGQGYANNILDPLSDFKTIEQLSEHIQKHYDIPKDKAQSVIENIILLYATGSSSKDVAQGLRGINDSIEGDWFLEEKVIKPLMKEKQILEEEKELMIENFILKRRIDIEKSRNIMLEVFNKIE